MTEHNPDPRPPRLARWLIHNAVHLRFHGEIEADLEEVFQRRCRDFGEAQARSLYWRDVISVLVRPRLRLRFPFVHRNGAFMLHNYVKLAVRHVRKDKVYALVNIIGLSFGIAGCLLILWFLQDELSYDRHHPQAERTYRITETELHTGMGESRLASTPFRLAPALQQEFAGVESVCRIYPSGGTLYAQADARYTEDGLYYVDSTFTDVFALDLVHGDARTALRAPFSILLSETAARKYFGDANPLGSPLMLNDRFMFTVTGVYREMRPQSHFRADLLASMSSLRQILPWANNWNHPRFYTYAKISTAGVAAEIQSGLPAFAEKHLPGGANEANHRKFGIQPMVDIHLHSHLQEELAPNSAIAYIYIFGVIALLILCTACFNFINLSTARSAVRAREVGMRKALGAHRSQIMRQFFGESVVTVLLAFALGLALALIALPSFNTLASKTLSLDLLGSTQIVISAVGLLILVALAAGSYPSFVLSAFQPVRVLKGQPGSAGISGRGRWRKSLVIVQFLITSALLLGTATVYQQLRFLQDARMGFNGEQIVVIPLREMADQLRYSELKRLLKQSPRVRSVAGSSGVPTRTGLHEFRVIPAEASLDSLVMLTLAVDDNFFDTYEIPVRLGRGFDAERPADVTSAFVLNEAASKKLGWINPLQQKLTLHYYGDGRIEKSGEVIGVVQDFHYHSLHHAIDPILFHVVPQEHHFYYDYASVRIRNDEIRTAIAELGQIWTAFKPSQPLDYFFLDAEFEKLYAAERRLSQLVSVFTALAIFIACLGLSGLAAFTLARRRKEISLRRVLGASLPELVWMLSLGYVKLVAVAFVLAVPLAWLALNEWLQTFAYRISPSLTVFALTGVAALLIALGTVGLQSLRAGRISPVEVLREE